MGPTGPIQSWSENLSDVGPIYPLVGWEGLMFTACVVFCVVFMVWKFKTESAAYAAKAEHLRRSGELEQLFHSTRDTSHE